jgi:hypothetical protein
VDLVVLVDRELPHELGEAGFRLGHVLRHEVILPVIRHGYAMRHTGEKVPQLLMVRDLDDWAGEEGDTLSAECRSRLSHDGGCMGEAVL